MTKKTLTDRAIRALKPAPAGQRYDVADSIVPGLAVRVTSGGHRSFILTARYPGSTNPTRRALGDYGAISLEEARGKAREWLASLKKGQDPKLAEEKQRAVELRKQATTFAALAEDFIKDKLASERRGWDAENDIRREFLPRWAALPVTEITEAHIVEVIKAAKGRGAIFQAFNLLTLARRLFSWAIDQRCYGLESSPCGRLRPKLIGKKKPRQRILSDAELRALWKATESIGYPYGPLFRLLALSGQRKSEVGEAVWSEFDIDNKVWIIPAERMKANAAHLVPLSDDAIEILQSLPRFNKGDHLFSTDFGVKPVNGFSKGKLRLDTAMKAELGGELADFVLHDIRRTMRTNLSALPVSDLVRELVIAHTKPGLHKVYDLHAYQDEKARALDLWAARLRMIVSPDSAANVIRMKNKAN